MRPNFGTCPHLLNRNGQLRVCAGKGVVAASGNCGLTCGSRNKEAPVFDQIGGLPVHVLVIHVVVVFVPLLALGAAVYAVVPRWRPRIGWAVFLLAIIAPVVTFAATRSGAKFYDRVVARGISATGKRMLDDHMGFGQLTMLFTLALGIVTLIMVIVTVRRPGKLPRAAELGLSVIMVALAAISGYYVFRTGDSGAHVVWGTY
jgi:hypothetical protein